MPHADVECVLGTVNRIGEFMTGESFAQPALEFNGPTGPVSCRTTRFRRPQIPARALPRRAGDPGDVPGELARSAARAARADRTSRGDRRARSRAPHLPAMRLTTCSNGRGAARRSRAQVPRARAGRDAAVEFPARARCAVTSASAGVTFNALRDAAARRASGAARLLEQLEADDRRYREGELGFSDAARLRARIPAARTGESPEHASQAQPHSPRSFALETRLLWPQWP